MLILAMKPEKKKPPLMYLLRRRKRCNMMQETKRYAIVSENIRNNSRKVYIVIVQEAKNS